MKYKLFHKRTGINASLFLQFCFPHKIIDFVNSGNNKFHFIANNSMFMMENGNIIPYRFNFASPQSISFQKSIFVSDNYKVFEINSFDSRPSKYSDESDDKFICKHISKIKDATIKTKVDKYGNVYYLIKEISRIFCKSSEYSTIKCIAGNGYATYSQGLESTLSSLNFPSSIDLHGNNLYIADTGNGMVRKLKDNQLIPILGSPNDKSLKPSQIIATKDMLYYLSNNVYTTNLSGAKHSGISIYVPEGDIILCKDICQENSIYLMEYNYAN